jgi:hypothetical protein
MHQPRTFGRAVYKRQGDDFARQRSRYLDIFSEAELRLSQLYIKLGLKKHDGSFGQKVGELSSLKPVQGYPKQRLCKSEQFALTCHVMSKCVMA